MNKSINHTVVYINTSCIYTINDEKTDFSYRQNSVYNKESFFLKKGKHDNGLQKILAIIKKNAPFRFVRKDALSF